jgi:hypothetical protein
MMMVVTEQQEDNDYHQQIFNKIMKYILSVLLKYPLFYVAINGLVALTGLNIWWCVPIAVVIGISYDFGEFLQKRD